MLFNSYQFLLCFLPATLFTYHMVSRLGRRAVIISLGIASLVFYGYWQPSFLLILGSSILWNFFFSRLISRTIPNKLHTRLLLWVAIAGDLSALCWYKYLFPLLQFFARHLHSQHQWMNVLLPLGISFFTFTQIAYLVDLQQGGATQQNFWEYLLFVTFFPHLIAGPILHHKDIMPQFQRNEHGLRIEDVTVGLSWFSMGLFKKVILADHISPVADMVFASHGAVRPLDAWIGALAYSLQLYFDFSGYCDMACGLARMFSIDFPLNFSSPYKAASIIEFWQRWHMTLTQYIGAYLFTPVQRWIRQRRQEKGKKVDRQTRATIAGFWSMIAVPTLFTMFIAGIWHGAGTQFLIFGLLHGSYMTINHAWRTWKEHRGDSVSNTSSPRLQHAGSVLITFGCVLISLVFFRSEGTHAALALLARMFAWHTPIQSMHLAFSRPAVLTQLALLLLIVWAFPNTQQILARYKPALQLTPCDQQPRLIPIYWEPRAAWAIALGGVMIIALIQLQNPSSFLYFQF